MRSVSIKNHFSLQIFDCDEKAIPIASADMTSLLHDTIKFVVMAIDQPQMSVNNCSFGQRTFGRKFKITISIFQRYDNNTYL